MPRGIWKYLERLPPIDWALIAHERRTRRPSRQQVAEWNAKAHKSRKRNIKTRRKAALARAQARWRAWRRQYRQAHITARMLGAMQPGEWYGRPDIRDLSGVSRDSVHARLSLLERGGLVKRARNPEFKPVEYRKGIPMHIQAKGRAPEFLFSLTPDGEAKRAELAYLL